MVLTFGDPLPWLIGGISQCISWLRRKPNLFNVDKIREATASSWACSPAAVRQQLGFEPPPLSRRLHETAQWYRGRRAGCELNRSLVFATISRSYQAFRGSRSAAAFTRAGRRRNRPVARRSWMLTIYGRPRSGRAFCDGLRRRDFLQIGGLVMGGISLPQLLAAEAKANVGRSHKAVINIFLPGGPPHQDMWDLKMDAPAEIRGEFEPIKTNVAGIEICELFPRIAGMMDKFVPIRTIVGARGDHYAHETITGRRPDPMPAGGWPAMGAWVSKLQGPVNRTIPPHLSLFYKTGHAPWGDPGNGGFLGVAHAPFRLVGGQNETSKVDNMVLKDVTLERLGERQTLLRGLDRFRREADASGAMDGLDAFTEQAMGILTSSALAEALDLAKEDPALVERYGKGNPEFHADGAPRFTENFLIARRLVEAGARVVSLNFSRWDWHGSNFQIARQEMPLLDRALSALVEDLDRRGLLPDVSVVCWGEFGRTPKINNDAGRDHWPQVSCALLAGGGMRTGQVVGATNRLGEFPVERPVTFQEVFATLYHNLGLDVRSVREFDLRGRPQYLVDADVEPLKELI